MNILMIVPYLPYPLVSGGQNRTYNLLKGLSKKHEITLISFIRDYSEKQYVSHLRKYCKKIITIKRSKYAWSLRNILLAAITPYPFVVTLYLNNKAKSAIVEELRERKYDLIHAETFYIMPNIPRTNIPVLLVEQTIEYMVYQDFVQNLPWYALPLKLLALIDVTKIKWWERHFWKKAQGLATMSEEDKKFINLFDPILKIDVIANGVDTQYFDKTQRILKENLTVLFVGQFRWLPNRDAAKFLVRKIWPLIKEQIPNAKLWIVGRNPTNDIITLANESQDIFVDGRVEDIREAYGKSSVLLAPIRSGHGTKFKVLEAMATRTPVVGTPLAVEGIGVENGKEVLIGNTASELASATIRILKNKNSSRNLAKSAYKLVKTNYSWQKIASELDKVYQRIGEISVNND